MILTINDIIPISTFNLSFAIYMLSLYSLSLYTFIPLCLLSYIHTRFITHTHKSSISLFDSLNYPLFFSSSCTYFHSLTYANILTLPFIFLYMFYQLYFSLPITLDSRLLYHLPSHTPYSVSILYVSYLSTF